MLTLDHFFRGLAVSDHESTSGDLNAKASEPWFARQDVDVLYYRINRRPIGADASLFAPEADLVGHLRRVLDFAEPGSSGRKHKRLWRLGNLQFNGEEGTFTGHFGWARSGEAVAQGWDTDAHEWIDRIVTRDDSAVSPVAFTLAGRILGIMKHPSFSTEDVLDSVLSEILNKGESRLDFPTTVWSVEPLGDTNEFRTWVDQVDQLNFLRLVFKRPNPDGAPEFQELFDRLDRFAAESIEEDIRARDETVGLDKDAVLSDPQTKGFLHAAMIAFGRVFALGRKNGKNVTYDQRHRVLRDKIDSVGSDWDTATETVLGAVVRRGQNWSNDGQSSN